MLIMHCSPEEDSDPFSFRAYMLIILLHRRFLYRLLGGVRIQGRMD